MVEVPLVAKEAFPHLDSDCNALATKYRVMSRTSCLGSARIDPRHSSEVPGNVIDTQLCEEDLRIGMEEKVRIAVVQLLNGLRRGF